jgi:hypothetical protein
MAFMWRHSGSSGVAIGCTRNADLDAHVLDSRECPQQAARGVDKRLWRSGSIAAVSTLQQHRTQRHSRSVLHAVCCCRQVSARVSQTSPVDAGLAAVAAAVLAVMTTEAARAGVDCAHTTARPSGGAAVSQKRWPNQRGARVRLVAPSTTRLWLVYTTLYSGAPIRLPVATSSLSEAPQRMTNRSRVCFVACSGATAHVTYPHMCSCRPPARDGRAAGRMRPHTHARALTAMHLQVRGRTLVNITHTHTHTQQTVASSVSSVSSGAQCAGVAP